MWVSVLAPPTGGGAGTGTAVRLRSVSHPECEQAAISEPDAIRSLSSP